MPNFHRFYIPNSLVFITSVTCDRKPLFRDLANLEIYSQTLQKVKELYPFRLIAFVILYDHFHWLMCCEEPNNFSQILHSFKRNFTINYKKSKGIVEPVNLWQERFWDHVIRNENDLNNHFDYIHWNPVKHGLAASPSEWEHSSFHSFVKEGLYTPDWGTDKEPGDFKKIVGE
jgi:putative transposase